MLEWSSMRLTTLRKVLWRPKRRWLLVLWGGIGTWDLLVAQFLPEELANSAPRAYDVLNAMSGWLSAPWWVAIGAVIAFALAVEYIVRRDNRANSPHADNGVGQIAAQPDTTVYGGSAGTHLRQDRAARIDRLYADAVALRNHVFSLRVVDAVSEQKMDEIKRGLLEEMRHLAPERAINLNTINTWNPSDQPRCLLQYPNKAMIFSEFLRRVAGVLEGL